MAAGPAAPSTAPPVDTTTPQLYLERLRIQAIATQSGVLPGFLGSTLRGALGWTLRAQDCVTGAPRCDGCPHVNDCRYAYLFETRSELKGWEALEAGLGMPNRPRVSFRLQAGWAQANPLAGSFAPRPGSPPPGWVPVFDGESGALVIRRPVLDWGAAMAVADYLAPAALTGLRLALLAPLNLNRPDAAGGTDGQRGQITFYRLMQTLAQRIWALGRIHANAVTKTVIASLSLSATTLAFSMSLSSACSAGYASKNCPRR